jgi:hypothetical protein
MYLTSTPVMQLTASEKGTTFLIFIQLIFVQMLKEIRVTESKRKRKHREEK